MINYHDDCRLGAVLDSYWFIFGISQLVSCLIKEINQISIDYGRFIGLEINKFIKNDRSKIDFISSHGHTIFHNPDQKFTLQIGDGQSISNTTKLKK